jgi:hypothetical protein
MVNDLLENWMEVGEVVQGKILNLFNLDFTSIPSVLRFTGSKLEAKSVSIEICDHLFCLKAY